MSTILTVPDLAPASVRAAAGAAYLDERDPGWHKQIDIAELDLGCGAKCILGQLYRGYGPGLVAAGIVSTLAAHHSTDKEVSLGFLPVAEAEEDVDVDPFIADADALDLAWVREIEARL